MVSKERPLAVRGSSTILGELVAYNARVTLAPAVFFRRILSRNDAWLASWLPLDAEFHALLSLCQLAQCSGANFAPQLLVAAVSNVDRPFLKLQEF